MSNLRYRDVTVASDATGVGTAVSNTIAGILHGIAYKKTDYADGGTITVTSTFSGGTILRVVGANASTSWAPVTQVCDSGGTAVSGVYQNVGVSEAVKITVSGMGTVAHTGLFRISYLHDGIV